MQASKLDYAIASLRNDVSRLFGKRLETTTDYQRLADAITASRTGYVSASTLKRYWGYVKSNYSTKRLTSLDALARYVGYDDFNHYMATLDYQEGADSDYNSAVSLDVQTLRAGTRLSLDWHPDRCVIAVYEGDLTFKVEESRNSRLNPGMIFKCLTMVKGQPLILNVFGLEGLEGAVVYIAGKKFGIDWKII